ncbi:MAG: preprotein translocase subunit SecA [Bacteroidales bacterium]|nr:preprotein translocase subunit SecA [Bacteroidales bacterium]MBN2820118.1 preprotein translocase subunit SecA [Bacteroidales bacterium]
MSVLTKILGKILGDKSERDIKDVSPLVEAVKVEFEKLQNISNDELRAISIRLKAEIQNSIKADQEQIESLKSDAEKEEDISKKEGYYDQIDKIEKEIDDKIEDALNKALPQAFAVVKETARRFNEQEFLEVTANENDRNLAAVYENIEIVGNKARYANSWMAGGNKITWDMVHYDVQLIGGVVLHQGKIAEMATGEGKTLVATLPVFLNALSGRGVHIVTVNDYLAKRDSEWMGPLYQFHGLSVDCIDKHQPNSTQRRNAYQADITFGTNNEFGFDYLRDNMAISPADLVQRRHNYSIVDEVDSVLIDDARTPLIISGPVPKGDNQEFEEFKPRVEKLVNLQRKLVTELLADAKKLISSGDKEKGGFKLLQAFKGLPKNKALIKYMSEEGIKALLHKTENFYMQDASKNMHKVTDELYFVIDEKLNSVDLTDKGLETLTSTTDDANFFIMPDIGSEIADLEKSTSSEKELLEKKDRLIQDYAIKSDRIHTVNQLLKAYAMFEKDVEYVLMDNKVKIVDEQTGRIMEGRRYSDGLHQAIEAKEHVKVEAATQTYATITLQNYFRMYHKLAGMTGTAETEAGELWDIYKLDVVVIPTNRPISRNDREDLVYRTKREKYNAVIDECVSLVKQGRPVLVGTTSVEISELLSRMLKMKGVNHNVLNAKLHQREADIVAEAGKAGTVTIATNMAGRGTDIKLSAEVKAAGGLAIIGTERHESRRVDRQLRGRAGRQGDPGSSQFYVSLEDDLMRLFGSDRIATLMDRMGLKEGEVIQHSMITKSIERAQKKVEENNFGIRKRLLEYDDVMNNQREVIYKKRRHALYGERIQVDIANMMYEVCESLVEECHGNVDYEDYNFEVIRFLSISNPISEEEYLQMNESDLTEKLYHATVSAYARKADSIKKQAFPIIKHVHEHQASAYENILVPITDGSKTYNVVTNLEKNVTTECQELVRSYEKSITLATIDDNWKEHLRELDDLKQSVQNATYEQKDPLLIYKFESFELFKNMIDTVNKETVGVLMKGQIPIEDPNEVKKGEMPRRSNMSNLRTSKSDADSYGPDGGQQSEPKREERRVQPVRVEKKVGRNDPCPCGSGKKYKNCHGKPQ